MHIGVLTHNYPRFPGDYSGNFVASLSEELAHQGATVTVLAPWDPAYERIDKSQVGNYRSEISHSATRPTLHLWRYAPRDRWHQLGYMRTMEADVRVRRNTYWLGPLFFLSGTAATVAWCRRHRPDVLHAHWLLPNGFLGAIASRLLDIPLVVSIPGSDALIARQNPLLAAMARFTLAQASLITANSHSLQEVAIRELGADPGRFELIIYGVDPAAMRPDVSGTAALRTRLGIEPQDLLLLAVGRMVYKKGFDVLIRALGLIHRAGLQAENSPLPRLCVAFIGDGDLWQAWQQLARDQGVDSLVQWLGPVPFDQMSQYYNAADGLVMPSVTRPATGLSVCVLDAMACGRPIIGTTAAGNPLVIEERNNGYLVPEGDPAALARAILRFAALPAARRASMGAASRQLIETQFAWQHLARRYLDHFDHLAGR